jgi:hypothetical protein
VGSTERELNGSDHTLIQTCTSSGHEATASNATVLVVVTHASYIVSDDWHGQDRIIHDAHLAWTIANSRAGRAKAQTRLRCSLCTSTHGGAVWHQPLRGDGVHPPWMESIGRPPDVTSGAEVTATAAGVSVGSTFFDVAFFIVFSSLRSHTNSA